MGIKFNPLSGLFDLAGSSAMSIGGNVAGSTPHAILRINGSQQLDQIGPLTDGQLIIGVTGGAAQAATLTGTTSQITVTTSPGGITLTLPQDIDQVAEVEFGNVSVTSNNAPPFGIYQNNFSSLGISTNGFLALEVKTNSDVFLIGYPEDPGANLNIHASNNDGITSISANGPGSGAELLLHGPNNTTPNDFKLKANGNDILTYDDATEILSTNATILTVPNSLVLSYLGDGPLKQVSGAVAVGNIDLSSEVTGILAVANGGTNLSTAPSNGQLLIGNGTGYTLATVTGTSNQVSVTNGAGSITLSLPQDIHTGATPTFASVLVSPAGGVDTNAVGTLAIGTGNADVINIGNAGVTVNVQGDTFYQNVTNLQVTDKLITINKGGSAGSASNAGIEIEENSVITGYLNTTADRLGYEFKAPASAGIVTIVPGTSGFTIDQGSHDPVTIGTANGLSLSTQQISLALSSTSITGALSSTDWNTFNNKQPAGNYITELTGDVSASGPGSVAATLASVGTAGTYTKVTTDAKGRVTSGVTQITLTTDVTGILPVANGGTNLSSLGTANQVLGVNTGATSLEYKDIVAGVGLEVTHTANTITLDNLGFSEDDISETVWSDLADNTADQVITGFAFSNTCKYFDALVDVELDVGNFASATYKMQARRRGVDWSTNEMQLSFIGDPLPDLTFTIDSTGQVLVSTSTISGFVSGIITFRAITLS